MSSIPYDVAGVIMGYAATTPKEALSMATVSSVWHQAFESDDELWDVLIYLRWGGRHPSQRKAFKKRGLRAYRERVVHAKGYTPLTSGDLHPIEDCTWKYKCPLFAESLQTTDRVAPDTGNPIFYCDVCKDDVYFVTSNEEKNQRTKEGRCIFFTRKRRPQIEPQLVSRNLSEFPNPIRFVCHDREFAVAVMAQVQSTVVDCHSWNTSLGLLDLVIKNDYGTTIQVVVDIVSKADAANIDTFTLRKMPDEVWGRVPVFIQMGFVPEVPPSIKSTFAQKGIKKLDVKYLDPLQLDAAVDEVFDSVMNELDEDEEMGDEEPTDDSD